MVPQRRWVVAPVCRCTCTCTCTVISSCRHQERPACAGDAQEQVLATVLRLLMRVVRQGNEPEPEEEDQGDGDAVLVTEADSPIGEQIVLQLILAR